MDSMVYKGYESTPKHDEECGVFYGLVDGIEGLAEYESDTLEGVEQAFRDAVDDYIEGCGEAGVPAFEGDESHGYPKPMDPKDVKSRIVGEVDEHGRTVLPAEEYYEEDDVYDELYPAPFASEAEACDFAEAATRDVIDGLCEHARCGVRFVDLRYADECLGSDFV